MWNAARVEIEVDKNEGAYNWKVDDENIRHSTAVLHPLLVPSSKPPSIGQMPISCGSFSGKLYVSNLLILIKNSGKMHSNWKECRSNHKESIERGGKKWESQNIIAKSKRVCSRVKIDARVVEEKFVKNMYEWGYKDGHSEQAGVWGKGRGWKIKLLPNIRVTIRIVLL